MDSAPRGARPAMQSWGGAHERQRILAVAPIVLAVALCSAAIRALAQEDVKPAEPVREDSRRHSWTVTPSVAVSETYTDNVFLTSDGTQTSDWVTQLVPALSVQSSGPRLRLDAVYAPQIMHYARTEREDNVFQKLDAVGTLVVTENLLFLEAGAKVDQYDVSLRGPITTSNVNITDNRATALTSYVSPYLRHDFGSAARVEARYTHSRWRSDEDEQTLPDNDAGRVLLKLESGPAYRAFAWKMQYTGEEIRYVTDQKTTSQVFLADGRRLVSSTVGLLMQAGYERYDTGIAFDALEDPRWSLGLDWSPTPRTRVAATAGKRLDENAYSFEFHHRTRVSYWSATYGEDVTTARSQFFVPATASTSGTLDQMFRSQYPDPTERQRAVQAFLAKTGLPPTLGEPVNFFSDELFLQKRWTASVGLQGARNTLFLGGFWDLRRALTQSTPLPGDFGTSNSIRMTGAGAAWSWLITTRTTWNLEAGYTHNDFLDTDQVDNFTYLRAGFTRQLQQRVSASIFYRRQQLVSNVATNYVENAGIATLKVSF